MIGWSGPESRPLQRGLPSDKVRRLLAVVPDTPVRLRNRALILTRVLTGRRRAEVFRLARGDLSFDGDTCFYSYTGARAASPDAVNCPARRWRR
jgi:integrase